MFGAYSFLEGVCAMFMRITVLLMLLILPAIYTTGTCGQESSWKMIHGDVLQVFPDQHKILVESQDEKQIFRLDEECQIFRLGVPTSLLSMRPVDSDAFQDVLCWVNYDGHISHIL